MSRRKIILYVAPHLPGPVTSGGAQRTALLLDALSTEGTVESIYLPSSAPTAGPRLPGCLWSADSRQLERSAARRLLGAVHVLLPPDLQAMLVAGRHRWMPDQDLSCRVGDLTRYDLVVSRYLSPALVLGLQAHPRLLIDVDDYDPDRLRLRLAHASPWKRLTLTRCLRHSALAHARHLPRAAHCWVSHPGDRRHPGLAEATLLPNIPYLPAGLPEPRPVRAGDAGNHGSPPTLLFVGTLSYSANSDGIDAFLREAWPAILHARPNARLQIVGQGLSPRQRSRWGAIRGVEPVGFLDDLTAAYASCRATIAPLLAGAGTNIKVLEAAAYARACVVTPVSHRGFEHTLLSPTACLRAESIREMATPCLDLLAGADRAEGIGLRAREVVRRHYTVEAFTSAVRSGCDRAFHYASSTRDSASPGAGALP